MPFQHPLKNEQQLEAERHAQKREKVTMFLLWVGVLAAVVGAVAGVLAVR